MRFPLLRVGIQFENDISLARQRLAQLCGLIGFSVSDRTRLVTALSEIGRNAFRYAGSGTVEVFARQSAEGPLLETVVTDHGPGIKQIEAVKAGTYESRTGMGLGISGARRLVDTFELRSSPGEGTRVLLGKRFPSGARLTAAAAQRWAVQLTKETPKDVYELLQMQNQELMGMMETLRAKERELDSQLQRAGALNTELRSTNDQLQQEIAHRRRAEAELVLARDAAESAARAKAEFLANMSHEIRTPMNAVIGVTRILAEEPLLPEQRNLLSMIQSSGEALLAVINDILDYSKIESGKLEVERIPMDLCACVAGALSVTAPAASRKGLELVLDMPPDVPEQGVGDPVRLRQVLINLLGNAVKFTAEGEVTLTVSLAAPAPTPAPPHAPGDSPTRDAAPTDADGAPDGSPRVVFQVRDTGIGIPPDRLESIFDAFSQADSSTTRMFQGTGLGLAISRRLVSFMGGLLTATSRGRPGEGAAFTFTLPLLPVGAEHGAASECAPAPRPAALDPAVDRLRGRSALVVEDQATACRVLRTLLDSWGMDVHCATSASAALSLAESLPSLDLALVDYTLPALPGDALARRLTALPAQAELPVILMRPVVLPGDVQLDSRGTTATLTKPVNARALRSALERTLLGEAAPTSHEPQSVFDLELGSRHPLRILLAEDNRMNQRVALMTLERLGYHADLAETGLEVLERVERAPYDVILMDVSMPEMDGLEASRQIQTLLPPARRPRVVAMTASVLEDERRRCREAGMQGWVAKPIDLDELMAALEETVRLPQPDAASAADAPPPQGELGATPDAAPRAAQGSPTLAEETTAGAALGVPAPIDLWTAARQAPVLDSNSLEAYSASLGGGELGQSLVLDLIRMFEEDAPAMLEAIRLAVDDADPPRLQCSAHALKGSSANLGAERLSQLCYSLELLGKSGTTQGAAPILAELTDALEALGARLAQERSERWSEPA